MKVFVKTYGCKVNQYESQLLTENFEQSGHEISGQSDSDIVVVNTCCVTEKAEAEARRFARKILESGKEVWITGCAVKKDSELSELKGVKIFRDKKNLMHSRLAGIDTITGFNGHTRAFVKIEDGCENFCAYCIVPYVRGPVKSRCEGEILSEIQSLACSGYKEIVLTGVDLGAYGRDSGTDLTKLIEKISRVKGIERLRISSIEVFHLNERLIEYLADNRLFCPHFHIPLQSGSDRTLSSMGRRYALSDYLGRVDLIRKKVDNVTFTTDAIVGFPGETDEDFRLTCRAIEKAGFLKVHIFRYSKRIGTRAYLLEGHLLESVKRAREKELRGLSEKTGLKIQKGFIDSPLDVLAEKRCGDEWEGYSSNYMPAVFRSGGELINEVIRVKAERLEGRKLFCVAV